VVDSAVWWRLASSPSIVRRALRYALSVGTSLQPALEPSAPVVEAAPLAARAQGRAANIIRFCDAERHAILRALELSGWRISGRAGAADSLGLKPTTLHAKMKRLGISRPSAESSDERYSSA
jgi:transcriptional regulator with GAF, ATPase, and Fis domain